MEYLEEFEGELRDWINDHMAVGQEPDGVEAMMTEGAAAFAAQRSFLFPWPWLLRASGLYEWKLWWPAQPSPLPIAPLGPQPAQENGAAARARSMAADSTADFLPFLFQREELRLDVDGRYPLMKASGTLFSGLTTRVHWIADLTQTALNTYSGYIWYKDGDTTWLPYTNVTLTVQKSFFPGLRKATVTFSGGGAPDRVRTYRWKTQYFRPVDFEYDTVEGTTAVTVIDTGAHPNRPPSLAAESLSIETVFRRAGFNVTTSPAGSVPISAADVDALWTDMEMHDAMQIYWSHYGNIAQWRMWVLFASLHVMGTGLGGIMFDDIGPNHRQGTALFNDSFICNPPPSELNAAAWVQRMKFWTACHEIGHAFNLAHSWQKSWGMQWIPLSNEPEARSFMNYPYYVMGGESAFFADFEFRFSDGELLFMRHAPERFVQMGNADWFDNHGFQQANVSPASPYTLEVRVHRDLAHFEFLEPVVVELKLTNRSSQPLLVDGAVLEETDNMTVIIKKRDSAARQWRPFAQYCHHADKTILEPGKSLYSSLSIASGTGGWNLAEPGVYTVQVALHLDNEDVVSNALEVRVAPPRNYDEEYVAQDFFSEDVGRVLAFDGSRHLEAANDVLREVVARFGDRRVAHHAQLALGNPLKQPYKLLKLEGIEEAATAPVEGKEFDVLKAQEETARDLLQKALLENPNEAADTLGHIEYGRAAWQYGAFLAEEGDPAAAAAGLKEVSDTLAERGVLPSVVEAFATESKEYAKEKRTSRKTRKKK